jgi:hypothetical protein
MSLTVDQPGSYTFACHYQDGRGEPEIRVALGPNYFWEFLRVVWKISLPLLGGSSVLCGSFLLALLLLVIGFVIKILSVPNLKLSIEPLSKQRKTGMQHETHQEK